jgi:hypothetical protein
MLITEEYREANATLHAAGNFGTTAPRFERSIRHMAETYRPATVIDYGSGTHRWVEKMLPDLAVQSYDPAVAELAGPALPADMLVSCDVLEHIEPECLTSVLFDMQRVTTKCAFVTIATRPAKKVLPDGRNAHLIVQPAEWWLSRLMGSWVIRAFFNPSGKEIELWMEPRS